MNGELEGSASRQRERHVSEARHKLIDAALASLIELGFSRTTGVEVCRRAGLTRGALNYHFPDYGNLLAAALGTAYDNLLDLPTRPRDEGPLEGWVQRAHSCIVRPDFKAIIELWLASQNDPELGATLSEAIAQGSQLFDPVFTLVDCDIELTPEAEAVYRTISEACVGLGVGRSVSGGPLAHETQVIDALLNIARDADRKISNRTKKRGADHGAH